MQNENNEKKLRVPYSIGLDIGTTSVGWAVIDNDYKIITKGNKKKPMWGAYLFDEATTAEARRGFRSTRRRYDRRRERIRLLQEIFQDEINKVDSNFFTKLKESFYHEDDIINKTIVLTKEEKEEMKSYQNKYPTIYHLRNKLLTSSEKEDIRLVYLAIHHIIKYRGNFNYNMSNFKIDNLDIKEKAISVINNIIESCEDIYSKDEPNIDFIDLELLEESLMIDSKRDKKRELEKIFQNLFHKKVSSELANALVGYTINLENLFAVELDEVKKIDFNSAKFDDDLDKLESELSKEVEVLKDLKDLYDMVQLKIIFKGDSTASISKLMVKYYDIHDKDLEKLKNIMRVNHNLFKKFFKDNITDKKEELCIYTNYVRNKLSYADFCNEVKKALEEIENSDNKEVIDTLIEKIDSGNFMPRITDTSNGRYPYQINEAELRKIIENQGQYYPFLKEEVNNELKLVTLLKFKIPYYVGPLVSKEQSKFAWLIRKSNEKITPFNFNEVIDKRKTAKEFILRMVGHCSYILDEKAMPNNSIFYSRFKVLNELKQIKINNRSLSENQEFIEKIYQEFFLKTEGSLTDTKFQKFLRSQDELSMYVDDEKTDLIIEGYSSDKKFANNMQSYIDFFGPNGIFTGTNLTETDADKIIELITIFEDKDILKDEILELYPMLEPQIKKIISKNYKGWSSLSRKLLETKYYLDDETNVKKSIMDLMLETRENFMQILNNKKYSFWDMINELNNQDENNELNYSLVSELATSPAVKKGIWQSLKIVKEIVDYMGYEPTNISVEMARENGKKERVPDRKKMLLNLYDTNKSTINNYNELKGELKNKEKIDTEKLLLYFLQEGKSLYSGKPLDITRLNEYEVDHILPRTLIKDDSIENKALVLRSENQDKKANLVLPSEFNTPERRGWWKHLKDINLMTKKKYYNLIRTEYSNRDIEGFINRQLVETRQITKHVANILKNLYKDSNIIYIKANISHNYRERFELYKYRDLNDYHHAHDAYLAIVLGIYQTKYLKTKINKYELKEMIQKLVEDKKYDELKYGYLVNSINQDYVKVNEETGEVGINIKDFTETIENTLYRNDIEVVKKTEIRTGEFYNQTKYKHNTVNAKIRIKENLAVEKYGGYTNQNNSYMILVRYKNNNIYENALIGIPISYIDINENDKLIDQFIKENLNCNEYIILKDKIPFNTTLIYQNQKCIITGNGIKSAEIINNHEFKLVRKDQVYYKDLLNYIFNNNLPKYNKEKWESYIKFKDYCLNEFDRKINEFFDLIIDKIRKEYPLYQNEYQKLKLVQESKEFYNLKLNISNEEKKETKELTKVDVVLELFKLLKCNSGNANLKLLNKTIKFSDRVGRKPGVNIKTGTLIYKSPAGLKEKRYEF